MGSARWHTADRRELDDYKLRDKLRPVVVAVVVVAVVAVVMVVVVVTRIHGGLAVPRGITWVT